MTGVKVDITSDVAEKMADIKHRLQHPAPLFAQINEYMMRTTRARFGTQTDPDGKAWQRLSARYQKRKHRNKGKVLTFRGYLQGTLRGQFDDDGLSFGTNNVYGAIHNFGGVIKQKARKTTVYFQQNKDGSIGNRFVKRKKSNFAQDANVGPYEINMPKRQWLGLSSDNSSYIGRLAVRWLKNSASS